MTTFPVRLRALPRTATAIGEGYVTRTTTARLAVYIRSQSFADGVACVSKGARLLTCHSICHFDRNRGDQVAALFIKFPSGVKLSQVFERLARLTELGSESQLGCLFVLPFVQSCAPWSERFNSEAGERMHIRR